jgi:sialate O-acetylesterase
MNLRPTLLACLLLAPSLSLAELRLPSFFSDHMVFQRDAPIPVWGWADPGTSLTVQLGPDPAKAVTVTASPQGRWHADLPASPAQAEGTTLTVSSPTHTITLEDVLVGEVWLCSGQSNMEWPVSASGNPAEEIAAADFPKIRHMKVAHLTAATPQDDVASTWQICSPATAANFTAVGYAMARELHRELGVPIGLLNVSWGGTRIEPWTPVEGFAMIPELAEIHAQIQRTLPSNELYQNALQTHIDDLTRWTEQARAALANRDYAPASPAFPQALLPLTANTSPTTIFNAMLHPIVGFGMRGAVWYQGESNRDDGMQYLDKKKALVSAWRELWGIGDFPFFFVQIAPFQYGEEEPAALARFWEAQSACRKIPNTGMVVTNDIADLRDIHPKNKQEVGRRLALLALKHTYGQTDLVASGPTFQELTVDGDTLRLKFDNVADGLRSRDGAPLSHFELAGEDATFVPATATIEGTDTVVLSAEGVKNPAAMRFAWHKLAEPNLANGAGLPASAFRAGQLPDHDLFPLRVPDAGDYELIYDLDLTKLAPQITYTLDRSAEIQTPFDRIGYFMELTTPDGARQWAWTSMAAFTEELAKLAIPTLASGSHFQLAVQDLTVLSNVDSVTTGEGLAGNIEFWPHNYGPTNSANVDGASDTLWDFGDSPVPPADGYGSMQVHHTAAAETVFAINNWKAGASANLGIGNSSADPRTTDWTFVANASSFEAARLRVFIRTKD